MGLTEEEQRVARYWHVVASVARRHSTDAQPWLKEELLGVGYETLLRCARRFDPDANPFQEHNPDGHDPFERYARYKINQAMIDEVRRLRPGARWKGRPRHAPMPLTTVGGETHTVRNGRSNTSGGHLTGPPSDDPYAILERRDVIEQTLALLDRDEARAVLARLLTGGDNGAVALGGAMARTEIIAKLRAAAA